jgi:ATP-dependent helicase/nuclease subunit B
VQDSLISRRLRELLERARVEVEDETGWTFSTLSVSTVLMRWLEALQGDFYYQDLLDLLKSPYLFFEDPSGRKQAAYLFEQTVRRHGVIAHLKDYIELAEREAVELVRPLVRLRQAARVIQRTEDGRQKTEKRLPLAKWLQALQESLEILGVTEGFKADEAGRQLLQQIAMWQDEMSSDKTPFSFSEWRRWLSQQLDLITYRDISVESPVLFTHLAATRWRSFEAALLLGADAAHLPAPVNSGPWFNDAVRSSLGLPLSSEHRKKVRDDLYCLLAMNDEILITWQAGKGGEHNLLSPYVEMLRAAHMLAFDEDLVDNELGGLIECAQVEMQEMVHQNTSRMPSPAVVPELVPKKISPSGYNSLMACPYQYYARHALGLNEMDEVRETLDKRDYGTWVHKVLQRFHTQIPSVEEMGKENAEEEMERISIEVFADGISRDYLAQGWLMRWRAMIPAYIDWQLENERSGMKCEACELYIEAELDENLRLYGKLDRLDAGENGRRVLDYKTKSATQLRGMIKEPGEDVQLPCYAHLSDAMDAAFLSLDGKKVETVSLGENPEELTRRNIERLKTIFAQIGNGQGLPANGAERACRYCEMNGLCRKGERDGRSA